MILVIVCICGIVVADVCVHNLQDSKALLDMEIFKNYAYADIAFKNVIWNMLYERGKLLLGLFVLCLTPIKNKIPVICTGIFVFCFGFFLMSSILALGFVGIFVALGCVFPHGVLYTIIFVILYRKHVGRSYHQGKSLTGEVVTYLFLILLFVTSCVMECVIGIHFVPWVIRLSLI